MMSRIDQMLDQVNYKNRAKTKNDILATIQSARQSLVPRIGELYRNDGSRCFAIVLEGMIQMTYKGAEYNIPVEIYIFDSYPEAPPEVFVRPSKGMLLRAENPFVDRSGFVSDPYITNWNTNVRASLPDLVKALSRSFGLDPPVRYPLPDVPRPEARPSSDQTAPPSYTAGYVQSSVGQTAQRSDGPVHAGSRKQELIALVASKLQEEMRRYYSRVRDEIDKEFVIQAELDKRSGSAEEALKDLRESKSELQHQASLVREKTNLLLRWEAGRTEDASSEVKPLDICDQQPNFNSLELSCPLHQPEDSLEPYDNLSAQVTDLLAENLAIDDLVYYLERALTSNHNETVDLSVFLREVRRQSRKQFLNKLHIRKIEAAVHSS